MPDGVHRGVLDMSDGVIDDRAADQLDQPVRSLRPALLRHAGDQAPDASDVRPGWGRSRGRTSAPSLPDLILDIGGRDAGRVQPQVERHRADPSQDGGQLVGQVGGRGRHDRLVLVTPIPAPGGWCRGPVLSQLVGRLGARMRADPDPADEHTPAGAAPAVEAIEELDHPIESAQ